jgi:FixJ family two-component response regulator
MQKQQRARMPTVFIVDDDDAVRGALALLIKAAGLQARAFASAEAFLDAYRPGRPGCLLADVHLPGMNGLELQALLSRWRQELPVIVMSGDGDPDLAARALANGAVDYLEKPFRSERLLARVHQALARGRRDAA